LTFESSIRPRLAAFPKAFMQALCKDGSMKVAEWIELASTLDVDGLEWYAGFLEMEDERNWARFRELVEASGKTIPMMCCSPDFTHPDRKFREREIAKQLHWIRMTYILGGSYCRVLSGQRREELPMEAGLELAAECIEACLPYAHQHHIKLILENHYKDDFWTFPEFAQKADVFCRLVDRIKSPDFGVNFDPSNTYLAGENPLELLNRISHRVLTMHASDRFLVDGTINDLRREEGGAMGYAKRLRHGEIGKGLNDYDAIFAELRRVGFAGWISIEDGMEGMPQLERSVAFVRKKMRQYWPL
jgi:sugar phosphate isomerase/epimerase